MSDALHPQLVLDITPSAEPSLDNFVPGANHAALAAVRELAPGRALYLWGPAGAGRSHLLRAAVAAQPGGLGLSASSPPGDWPEPDASGALPALVAIDDVHRLDGPGQARLFALYNQWRAAAATTRASRLLLSGDQAPLQLPLREDLRTRLGWDLVYRLELLSDADKRDALLAQGASRQLPLAPALIDWLLVHRARDMRQLTAILDALDRYSLATRRPVTLPLLKTMLAETPSSS